MSKHSFLVRIALLVVLTAAPATAQDAAELAAEIHDIRVRLAEVTQTHERLLREHDELRGSLRGESAPGLERSINALSAAFDVASTEVESIADPIRIFGEFRVRAGGTANRDFGARLLIGAGNVPPGGGPPGGGGGGNVGVDNATDDVGLFLDARFVVGFDFHFDGDIWTRFSMQANGLFGNGDTPGSRGAAAAAAGGGPAPLGAVGGGGAVQARSLDDVDLYEAFIQMDNIAGYEEFWSRSGRQEVVFGNEFQFGNNEYFSGETFDGEYLSWDDHDFSVHLFAGTLSIIDSFNTRDHPYRTIGAGDGFEADTLIVLYGEVRPLAEFNFDLYWIYLDGEVGTSVGTLGNLLGSSSLGDAVKQSGIAGAEYDYHTLGLRLHGVFDVAGGLDYNVEFAYQTGEIENSPIDVEGLALEAELGLTLDLAHHLRIFARFLFAEGAENDETGYIPLFPERHAYADMADRRGYRARYGVMDIIPMDNVVTAQVGVTFDPVHDFTVGATVLWAQHDEDVGPGLDDDIGWEVDLFAEYRHGESTLIALSIGVFVPDEGAPLKGGGFAGDYDDVTILVLLDTRVDF